MNELYEFLTGPALWAAFTIFIVGLIVRIVYLFALSKEKDRVLHNHASLKWACRSILQWLIPFGGMGFRSEPVFATASFVFHLCLLAVPLFLLAHNMLWDETFGVSLPALPDFLADLLTMLFMVSAMILLARRIIRADVRLLSTAWDYYFLVLTSTPFITGFFAYHQIGPYKLTLNLHIIFAEVLLATVPFTRLGHIALFFFSRAFIGCEMGRRRTRTW